LLLVFGLIGHQITFHFAIAIKQENFINSARRTSGGHKK